CRKKTGSNIGTCTVWCTEAKCSTKTLRPLISFFFQAEDGIRDPLVTGVQTCALPISPGSAADMSEAIEAQIERFAPGFRVLVLRSEERRVGKECRSGWWPSQ